MIEIGPIASHKIRSIPFYAIKQQSDAPYYSIIGNAYTAHGIVEVNQYWEDASQSFDQAMLEMILGGRRYRTQVRGRLSSKQITQHAKEFARQCYLLCYPENE